MVFARRLEKQFFFLSPQNYDLFQRVSRSTPLSFQAFSSAERRKTKFLSRLLGGREEEERGRASGRKTHVEDSPWRRANEEKSEEGRRSSEAERRRKQKKNSLAVFFACLTLSLSATSLSFSLSLSIYTHRPREGK